MKKSTFFKTVMLWPIFFLLGCTGQCEKSFSLDKKDWVSVEISSLIDNLKNADSSMFYHYVGSDDFSHYFLVERFTWKGVIYDCIKIAQSQYEISEEKLRPFFAATTYYAFSRTREDGDYAYHLDYGLWALEACGPPPQEWVEITSRELKFEMGENSGEEVWGYCGTDYKYHYFARINNDFFQPNLEIEKQLSYVSWIKIDRKTWDLGGKRVKHFSRVARGDYL